MDDLNLIGIVTLMGIVIGIGVIIFSIIKFKPEENSNTDVDKTVEKLATSIGEADNAIEEINKLSRNVLDEINIKYQELLYLYSLIDEKERELSSTYKNIDVSIQNTTDSKPAKPRNVASVVNANNPKHKEILELKNNGLNISEIAKKLNLGQGEVTLVLELGKDR